MWFVSFERNLVQLILLSTIFFSEFLSSKRVDQLSQQYNLWNYYYSKKIENNKRILMERSIWQAPTREIEILYENTKFLVTFFSCATIVIIFFFKYFSWNKFQWRAYSYTFWDAHHNFSDNFSCSICHAIRERA